MDIGGIEARGPQHVWIHGRTERQMTTDADAQRSQLTGAVGPRFQMVEHSKCVRVEARELFGGLPRIAAIGTRLVIRQHRPGSFKLVINFRDPTMYPRPASIAAVLRIGPATWKISVKKTIPGYLPGAAGRTMCVRIGP